MNPNYNLCLTNDCQVKLSSLDVAILAIGGGGAGGTGQHEISPYNYYLGGGGGGAGQYIYYSNYTLSGSFNITIGQGGVSNSGTGDGGNTLVGNFITSYGGGRGGNGNYTLPDGRDGASGGGAGACIDNFVSGSTGGQSIYGDGGYDGGNSYMYGGPTCWSGAGGGGAGGAGQPNRTGGLSVVNNITGSNVNYCRGGYGATCSTNPTVIANNNGWGGNGAGVDYLGQTGSDGIVIIRYSGTIKKATGGTITYYNGDTLHTFTSDGTFKIL